MERIETKILTNLIYNDEYLRKVIPFIKETYFDTSSENIVFQEILKYVTKYDSAPTPSVLAIEIDSRKNISDTQYKNSIALIDSIKPDNTDIKWLVDSTEKWCKDRAIYLALLESVRIADDNSGTTSKDAIPSILSEALSVSFDDHVGHDYIDDFESRYDYYHRVEEKVPFDLDILNKITKGGLSNKTLTIFLAGTGVGKSLFMCHMASSSLLQGLNVLYITLEMAEEKIAERIDANLLNVDIHSIPSLSMQTYESKLKKICQRTHGKLIIKEYPTASAHTGHFKSLLNDLELKRSFRPDIIFVDYLNICSSARYKGNLVNSYTYVKAIAEELRGLAVEYSVPIVSATQTTRSGYCLNLKTQVQTPQGLKDISNIQVGDLVLSNNGYNEVLNVFPKTKKKSYKITLEDGKEIICSEDHLFPTENGELNIKEGLEEGMCLYVKE